MAEQRLHFDTVAQLYEAVRPGYPEALIADIILSSEICPNGSILDIGCGTGKSTEPFARRGFDVLALDPAANMLSICKQKLSRYPRVSYENTEFETWSAGNRRFDLVISGTAFHWLADKAYEQLPRLVKPAGSVAVFWHTYLNSNAPFYTKLDRIYHDEAPQLWVEDLCATIELGDLAKEQELLSNVHPGKWRVIRYYEHVSYDARSYVGLLRTWSTHADLSETFFIKVARAIEEEGGRIEKPIRTTLCLGSRLSE